MGLQVKWSVYICIMQLNRLSNPYPLYGSVIALFLVLSAFITKGSEVLWLNGLHNSALDFFFRNITYLGEGILLAPLIIITLFVKFRYTMIGLLTAVLDAGIVSLFKRLLLYGLPRPRQVLDESLLHFVPGVEVHYINSFPSGHTATMFSLTLVVSLMIRKGSATLALAGLAVLVGASRIYLAQHFLIDVAAGAAMGFVSVFLADKSISHFKGAQWLDKRIPLGWKSNPI